jgi:hydroxymethylbilane synthase
MEKLIRIGTRESQLAVWQATQVQQYLNSYQKNSKLEYIRSEGDIDLTTPLYEMGVQGVFTRSLDSALLNNRIDIAVHSMKDVPTQLPKGIVQAAVLPRGPVNDLLVFNGNADFLNDRESVAHIATSSIRRKAQWLNRFPKHTMHDIRGNVNTRMRKLETEKWNAAIFAQAGLERIGLRPNNSIILDWMLPAPAQGAIMVVCREEDHEILEICKRFNDEATAICTAIERDFLRTLLGGCSTPISALSTIRNNQLDFQGSILSLDGREKKEIKKVVAVNESYDLGKNAAMELLSSGGKQIADSIRNVVS